MTVGEILWCYHSSETSSAVLSHGTIYLQWTFDLTKCQGTEEVCSLYRGFVTSKACLKFVIFVEFDSGVFGELKG